MDPLVFAYIEALPEPHRTRMQSIRTSIFTEMSDVFEGFSYQMPAYVFQKKRFYFACFKNHIGFFPGPEVIEAFRPKLTSFKTSKGTIQFQHNQEFPFELLQLILIYIKNK